MLFSWIHLLAVKSTNKKGYKIKIKEKLNILLQFSYTYGPTHIKSILNGEK